MDKREIDKTKAKVAKSFAAKFQQKGDFARQMKSARGYLSARDKKDAKVILDAEENLTHPRLRKSIDSYAVTRASQRLMQKAENTNPVKIRSDFWFFWISGLVFRLLVAGVAIALLARYFGAI